MEHPAYPTLYNKARTIVKKRVARWPSAYASGQVVQLYTRFVKNEHGPRARAYRGKRTSQTPLARWYAENWIDIVTGRPCGTVKTASYYPVCRPAATAKRLTPAQILDAVTRKQRAKKKTARYPAYFRKTASRNRTF